MTKNISTNPNVTVETQGYISPYHIPVKWLSTGNISQAGTIVAFTDDGSTAVILTEADTFITRGIRDLRYDRE